MPQASLGAQRSGQLAKCICQGKGCLATQKLVMTQKHAEALPTMKGQGREPRPTAWLSATVLTEATVARDPQKEASVSLPAALECLGTNTAGSCVAVRSHECRSPQTLWSQLPGTSLHPTSQWGESSDQRASLKTLDTY